MRISVIIPTFRRPANLERCLQGLRAQTRPPDEVLLAVRDDDPATTAFLAEYDGRAIGLTCLAVGFVGASEARNRCLDVATGDILVMTDDDTVPHADWLMTIHDRFEADPRLGGLGGPDWIGGQGLPLDERAQIVGKLQWWGRRVGNHHRGAPAPLVVEWLKGANMSFRREALAGVRFGRLLRGGAAQFAEDFAVSLQVKRAGWKLIYDPAVCVDHFPGPLTAGVDHRSLKDTRSLADASHNETVVLLEHLPPFRRTVFLIWSIAVGTRLLPGAMMVGYLLATRGQRDAISRCRTVWQGRLAGWRTWRSSPVESVRTPPVVVPDHRQTPSTV